MPLPSVFKNCPAEPSPAGNLKVVEVVTALGAFSPIKFVPLFVPSFNLISPPVEALLPTDNVSIALFESVIIAELAVS